jgi:hypothetical protein
MRKGYTGWNMGRRDINGIYEEKGNDGIWGGGV